MKNHGLPSLVPAIALMLLLADCGGRPPQPAASAAPEKPAGAPGAVELDAAAANRVSAEAVREEVARETIEASGRITTNAETSWSVGAVTEGRVVRVGAHIGDRVKAGQVLAGLHSHDIHEARADYRRALAEQLRAQSALALAQRQRDRARRLLELKAGPLEAVEHAEAETLRADAALKTADVEVARVRQHLQVFLQVPIEEPAGHEEGELQHDEDLVPVKSPAAGVVLRRMVTAGSVVTAGQELFLVTDLSRIWMIALVPEQYLGRLRTGMNVQVTSQLHPGRGFPGRITKLGEELDPETRTLQVRIELPNPGEALKPESYATAEIPLEGAKPAIRVPRGTVQDVHGGPVVFLQTGERRYEARPVQLGRTVDGRVEITQGLAPGDRVAVRGAFLLKSLLLRSSLAED